MHYARRFLTLAAALGVLFAGAQPANAVDFKVKGAFDVSFETSNVLPRGVGGRDTFGAIERLRTQIDAVAASLPDKGQKKLADRESDRRKREQYYASLSGWNRREALAAADPLALEAGEVSDT